MKDVALAKRIASLLNDALSLDPSAVNQLFWSSVRCNTALSQHAAIRCGHDGVSPTVGILGVLNGICQGTPAGGLICAITHDNQIVHFGVMEELPGDSAGTSETSQELSPRHR